MSHQKDKQSSACSKSGKTNIRNRNMNNEADKPHCMVHNAATKMEGKNF